MSDLQDVFETPSQSQKKTRRYILVFIFVLLLIIISVGAYQYLSSSESQQVATTTPTSVPTPTEAPTPTQTATPTAALTPSKTTPTVAKGSPTPTTKPSVQGATTDRSKLTITVQNGTGVGGSAKKAADMLTALGYTVSSTGNADAFTYEESVIKVKSSKKSFLSQLKTDVEESYVVDSATADLPESSATDAVVIVGK